MTDDDKELMKLTAQTTVDTAIEKILPIIDRRITEHQTACALQRLKNNNGTKTTKGLNGFFELAKKHWLMVLIIALLIYNHFSARPFTPEEIKQVAQQITKLSAPFDVNR